PISAVSLAAKNAEIRRQTITTENVIQSMREIHFICIDAMTTLESPLQKAGPHFSVSCSGFQLAFQKITNHRRFDVGSDHGATDRSKQDEREPSALDLLVLRHQRHQRIGIAESFL